MVTWLANTALLACSTAKVSQREMMFPKVQVAI